MRWRKGRGAVDIRGSIFCEVRDRSEQPLCEFYASAIRRLMYLFNLDVEVGTEQCRATGAGQCLMSVLGAGRHGQRDRSEFKMRNARCKRG